MLALLCAMSCVFVLSAMVPVYLVNVLRLSAGDMGVVTCAIGCGGFFGQFGWPGLSAIGMVVGAGEIFGGGIAPVIAGGIADAYGLPSVLNVALIGVVLGVVVCLFLRETAPVKVSARRAEMPG